MRFANPTACPNCDGRIAGEGRCPHCDLDLTSAEVRQLWQTLLQADALLINARAASQQVPASQEAPPVPLPPLPVAPPPAMTRPPARSISPGSVLLGLGALCLLVAGFIFITVSWGSLGVTGRALVLLAVTAFVGALASWVTRRRLRGSAEALWLVFLGLLTLDWFAAWGQGLFNLDELPFVAIAVGWSAVTFGAASLIVAWSRPRVGALLVAPMIVAGLAPVFGAVTLAIRLVDRADWSQFWAGVAATGFVAVFLVTAWRFDHRVTRVVLSIWTGLAAAFAVTAAVVEASESPSLHALTAERHGLPLALVVATSLVAGLVNRRVTTPAVVLAGLGTVLLFALPAEDAWPGRGAFVAVSAAVVLGALALGTDRWSFGCRITSAILAVGLLVAALPWVGNLLEVANDGANGSGLAPLWSRATNDDIIPGPWWLALTVFGALTAVAVLVRWWPETNAVRSLVAESAYVLGGASVMVVVAAAEPPLVVLALVVIAVGTVLTVTLTKTPVWTLIGPALVAVAPIIPLVSRSAALVAWLVAALVLGLIAIRSRYQWRREFSAFAGASWAMGAAGIAALLADAEYRVVALSLVVAAMVGFVLASLLLRGKAGRSGMEAAAALIASVGIIVAAGQSVSLSWQAALWTIAGAVLVSLSFAIRDRPFYRWAGSAALAVAYILRLAASDVGTAEAYTLPFGALLLAGGLWTMRRSDPPRSLVALGPGLTLALLPSVPMALDRPASLRALLLGLGALLVLGAGVWKHWKAPFIAGGLVLAALAIVNLGPYALAIPRWALIAGAGALLLGSGVTWEDRVRDGRAVAKYVDSMR